MEAADVDNMVGKVEELELIETNGVVVSSDDVLVTLDEGAAGSVLDTIEELVMTEDMVDDKVIEDKLLALSEEVVLITVDVDMVDVVKDEDVDSTVVVEDEDVVDSDDCKEDVDTTLNELLELELVLDVVVLKLRLSLEVVVLELGLELELELVVVVVVVIVVVVNANLSLLIAAILVGNNEVVLAKDCGFAFLNQHTPAPSPIKAPLT